MAYPGGGSCAKGSNRGYYGMDGRTEDLKPGIIVDNRDIKQFEERYNLNKIYNITQKLKNIVIT